MELFTFSEEKRFWGKTFFSFLNLCPRDEGGRGGGAFLAGGGEPWSQTTMAARLAIMTAADWEVFARL